MKTIDHIKHAAELLAEAKSEVQKAHSTACVDNPDLAQRALQLMLLNLTGQIVDLKARIDVLCK